MWEGGKAALHSLTDPAKPNGRTRTAPLNRRDGPGKVTSLNTHPTNGSLTLRIEALIFLTSGGRVVKRAAASELVRDSRGHGRRYVPRPDNGRERGGRLRAPGPEKEATAELSERKAEVVRLIALGYSNREIGARLKVFVKSVETYKSQSMEKLQIRSRVDIVRFAAVS